MNVGEIMEKIDEIESITKDLFDIREVTVDEDMAAAADMASDFLSEYAEMLKGLKIQR